LTNYQNLQGFRSVYFYSTRAHCLTEGQLGACILAIKNKLKIFKHKVGKQKIRIYFYPDIPLTEKSVGSRMGKGKGAPELWCRPIKKGRVLFSLKKLNFKIIRIILRLLKWKTRLNIRCYFF